MKQYKKPLAVYLGRTNQSHSGFSNYQIGTRKKEWDNETGFDASFITSFCGEEFERVTGLRLDKGEVLRVQLTVDVVPR